MSHGVHAVQHEVEHKIKHEDHAADHTNANNKRVALLIAVLALFLAFSETLGKSAQTNALSFNVEASNLWAFFQAKTIRITTLRTAADSRRIDMEAAGDTPVKAAMQKQVDGWLRTAARIQRPRLSS